MGHIQGRQPKMIAESRVTVLEPGRRDGEFVRTKTITRYVRQPFQAGHHMNSWPLLEPTTRIGRTSHSDLHLMIVMQALGRGPGEHWSLFVAPKGQQGSVYQVKGEHSSPRIFWRAQQGSQGAGDSLCMTYRPLLNVNMIALRSFRSHIVVAESITDAQHSRIRYWAERIQPLSAQKMRELRGHDQTWCIAVLEQLVREGISRSDRVELVRKSRRALPYY